MVLLSVSLTLTHRSDQRVRSEHFESARWYQLSSAWSMIGLKDLLAIVWSVRLIVWSVRVESHQNSKFESLSSPIDLDKRLGQHLGRLLTCLYLLLTPPATISPSRQWKPIDASGQSIRQSVRHSRHIERTKKTSKLFDMKTIELKAANSNCHTPANVPENALLSRWLSANLKGWINFF